MRKKRENGGDASTLVSKDLEINERWAEREFAQCMDVKMRKATFWTGKERSVLFMYCEGLAEPRQIDEIVIPGLRGALEQIGIRSLNEKILLEHWPTSAIETERNLDELTLKLFNGQLVLFFDGVDSAFVLDISRIPSRKPEDSNTEVSVRGPRDGFVEELTVNVALIRKRIKSKSMSYEQFRIGRRGRTRIGLLYIRDIIRPELVEEVRKRLSNIDIDALYSINELEEQISESSWSLFPTVDYTGRPDYAVASLLRGRFVLLLDGVPTVLIGPGNLTLLFKTAEDLHTSYSFVAFGRMLRLIGLFITLLLPGFYIGITTYHPDQIPLTLLATIVVNRKGVPFPTPLEAIIMLTAFELFREAGIRLPTAIGMTLTVVGGLVIGDASIRAGLTSPSLLVVIAITAVSSFTLVNQSLVGAVSIVRLVTILAASVLGIFGFLLSVFVILVYLAKIRSFGLPYLAPVSPFNFGDFVHALFRLPRTKITRRPNILGTTDSKRRKGAKHS
jgi:Bacillus/Clostridium GerA spore germination protein.